MRRRDLFALPVTLFARGERRLALLTHARRDAAPAWLETAAMVVAPSAEAGLWQEPAGFWREFRTKRYHDYAMLNAKAPARPSRVDRAVRPGERFTFEGTEFEVLPTPGPTRESVSYLATVDGRRTVYCGDLILAGGRLLDLWSLQDAVPDAKLRGYHGYAARAGQLIASLRLIESREPHVLVPCRGPVVTNPGEAIETLIANLKSVLREHFSTDALRWYFGDDNLRLRSAKLLEGEVPAWMPMAETRPLPPWMRAIGNSRLVISDTKAAFLMDCGYDRVIDAVAKLKSEGAITGLEGVFVTHYHDDHTDRAQKCAATYGCPVYFQARMKPILEAPSAFYMPCLTTEPIRSGKPQADGAKLRWHEFEFTFHDFPGQTLYHDALFLKRDSGESILYVGDSFTPSGLDDYCLRNRNFLSPGNGYFRCLDLIRSLPRETLLINQHVEPMFRFSVEQLDTMKRSLERRRDTVAKLTVYPHHDFALDDQWVRISPYECPSSSLRALTAYVYNHAPKQMNVRIRPVLPAGWRSAKREYSVSLKPASETAVPLALTPPGPLDTWSVLTFDVILGELELREFAEVLVGPPTSNG